MEWVLVYDLASDDRRVGAMQEASLRGEGLSRVPALVGAPEWWEALEAGAIERVTHEGTILSVYWASSGTWPEFELAATDGARSLWTRHGDVGRYVGGLGVRVTCVRHPWIDTATSHGSHHDLVVRIEIEQSDRRSDPRSPGPFGTGVW